MCFGHGYLGKQCIHVDLKLNISGWHGDLHFRQVRPGQHGHLDQRRQTAMLLGVDVCVQLHLSGFIKGTISRRVCLLSEASGIHVTCLFCIGLKCGLACIFSLGALLHVNDI